MMTMVGVDVHRFRVMEERFVDTSPTGPEGMNKDVTDPDPDSKKSPYTIIVSSMHKVYIIIYSKCMIGTLHYDPSRRELNAPF